jgi:LysR family transcriptional regulator, transcriptional activator of nhaA
MGQAVFRYADDMFSLWRELLDLVSGRPSGRPMRLIVVADVVAKSTDIRSSALRLGERVQIVSREADPDELLANSRRKASTLS